MTYPVLYSSPLLTGTALYPFAACSFPWCLQQALQAGPLLCRPPNVRTCKNPQKSSTCIYYIRDLPSNLSVYLCAKNWLFIELTLLLADWLAFTDTLYCTKAFHRVPALSPHGCSHILYQHLLLPGSIWLLDLCPCLELSRSPRIIRNDIMYSDSTSLPWLGATVYGVVSLDFREYV